VSTRRYHTVKLSRPQNQALGLLEEGPKTISELRKAMGARYGQVHLETLRALDYVELEGDKWRIKR